MAIYLYTYKRLVACFNRRVVTLVVWLILVSEANCKQRSSFLVGSSSFPYSRMRKRGGNKKLTISL